MNKIYKECKATNDVAVRAAASAGNHGVCRSSSLRRLERRRRRLIDPFNGSWSGDRGGRGRKGVHSKFANTAATTTAPEDTARVRDAPDVDAVSTASVEFAYQSES